MIMLKGIFVQAVSGLCECALRTDSACCRTTVGGKLNEVWPQDEHQIMHEIRLLKHVVLRKSEGSQKWLAPCGTELLVQLMSASLSRNLTGKLK
jgi:hypothetical protein